MKWTKRLKWIRASKIIIPIALAISVVFAGFSVFANEAQNFVVDISGGDGINLALTYNRDLTEQTDHLVVPILGKYRDVTWDPGAGKNLKYEETPFAENIPDDIALQEGVHTVFSRENVVSFFSFSFYLVNNSDRAVTVDMSITIDEMVTGNNEQNFHIDDAVRLMIIDDEHLLSENAATTVYKKSEINAEEEEKLKERTSDYSYDYPIKHFLSSSKVLQRQGEYTLNPRSVQDVDRSNVKRFTVVIWLEGWDRECVNEIIPEALKMSMTFSGL